MHPSILIHDLNVTDSRLEPSRPERIVTLRVRCLNVDGVVMLMEMYMEVVGVVRSGAQCEIRCGDQRLSEATVCVAIL